MPVQRTIKVTTTQEILKNEPKVQEFPMRKWSIEISLVGPNGEDVPANIFDKVTYILHPTFKDPTRAFKTPPFRLEEKGWGEFDLNINLHVAERGGEHKITHDLNFQKSRYEVLHTLSFPTNKPALLRLLAESGPVPEKKGVSGGAVGASKSNSTSTATGGNSNSNSNSNSASSNSNSNSNSIDGAAGAAGAAGGAGGDGHGGDATGAVSGPGSAGVSGGSVSGVKRKQGASGATGNGSGVGGEEAPAKFKKKPKIEKGSVDLERLADGLKMLGEDDLLGVVEMVTDNKTKDMYIKNDVQEGEFHMDLYTLPDPLLLSLWDYVKKRVSV